MVDWKNARCEGEDREMFYSDDKIDQEKAKAICHLCPIEVDCRQWALAVKEEFGVWGGMSAKERKAAKVKRPRIYCPGCNGVDVHELLLAPGNECCYGCGLSWRI